MGTEHDIRALKLAETAPEKSRNPHVQKARRLAEELYTLVANQAGAVPATGVIAGMLLEFAALRVEDEKTRIYGDAEARMRAEAKQMRDAMKKADEGFERIMCGTLLLPKHTASDFTTQECSLCKRLGGIGCVC